MRRLLPLLILISCMTRALPVPVGDAYELHEYVANGSFEDSGSAWAIAPTAALEMRTDDSASGSGYARITLAGTSFSLRQRLNGALGAGSYTLSFAARSSANVRLTGQVDLVSQAGITLRTEGDSAPTWDTIEAAHSVQRPSEAILTITGSGRAGDVVDIDSVRLLGPPPVAITPTPSATLEPTPIASSSAASPTTTAVASATPAPEPITSSVRNAGFEQVDATGAIASWETFGGSLSSATTPVRSGTRAARIESATDSTKWLHQPVVAEGGASYEFNAWIWHDDPNVAAAFLRVSWYASSDASGSALGIADSTGRLDAPYATYRFLTTGAIAAPPEARSAAVRIMLDPASSARGAIYVDDAAFIPGERAASPPQPLVEPSAAIGVADPTRAPSRAQASQRATGRRSALAPASDVRAPIDARIVINEVLYDAEFDETIGEWVELYNAGAVVVSLDGWELRDGSGGEPLGTWTLEPGEFVLVGAAGGDASMSGAPFIAIQGRIGNGLGNDGDALMLADPSGRIVDAISWGDNAFFDNPPLPDVPAGHSIERIPPGSGAFAENPAPSPGRAGVSTDSPRPAQARTVEILPAVGAGFGWLPWAIAASSGAALLLTIGWRTLDALRRKPTRV